MRLTTSARPVSTTRPASCGRDVAVVPEHADDVVDVVLALDQALAGVQRLGAGDGGLVALQQVGDPVQQRAALERGAARPVTRVEGVARGADRGRGCPRGRPRRSRPPGPVRRAADLAALAVASAAPIAPRRRAAARCCVRSVRMSCVCRNSMCCHATELRRRPVPSSTYGRSVTKSSRDLVGRVLRPPARAP